MKPALCPVCSGSGKYQDKSCHGCESRGWVTVPEYDPVQTCPSVIKIVEYPDDWIYVPDPYDWTLIRPYWFVPSY